MLVPLQPLCVVISLWRIKVTMGVLAAGAEGVPKENLDKDSPFIESLKFHLETLFPYSLIIMR